MKKRAVVFLLEHGLIKILLNIRDKLLIRNLVGWNSSYFRPRIMNFAREDSKSKIKLGDEWRLYNTLAII